MPNQKLCREIFRVHVDWCEKLVIIRVQVVEVKLHWHWMLVACLRQGLLILWSSESIGRSRRGCWCWRPFILSSAVIIIVGWNQVSWKAKQFLWQGCIERCNNGIRAVNNQEPIS